MNPNDDFDDFSDFEGTIALGQVANNLESNRPPSSTWTIINGDQFQFALALLGYLQGGEHNPPIVFDEGEFWRWNGTVWSKIDRMDVQRTLLHASEWACWDNGPIRINRATINSVLELAEVEAGAGARGFFADAQAGIAFRNGFAMVDEDGPHMTSNVHELRARHLHPYDFDVEAECPRWEAFLDGLFDGDRDAEEKKLVLQQFVGACLVGVATQYQRALMLVGSGSNGKSTLVNVIEALFPEGSVSAVSPQEMSSDRHVPALVGSLLNLVSDIPIRDLKETGGFKQVISGDAVAARPVYENPFRFRPRAGHIFSCNTLPLADDMTHGFFRRWIVLTFNREFRPEEQVPHSELIPSLLEELPGIMAWALRGAADLMKARRFFIPSSSQAAMEDWRQVGDQVLSFLDEAVVRIPDWPNPEYVSLTATQVYELYVEWATKAGMGRLSRPKLLRRVRDDHKVPSRRMASGIEYGLARKRQGQ